MLHELGAEPAYPTSQTSVITVPDCESWHARYGSPDDEKARPGSPDAVYEQTAPSEPTESHWPDDESYCITVSLLLAAFR